jgi:hypothetical protein
MNEGRFKNLLIELIDENPFAIRAMLKILDVEFTARIPTLAVTCEERPKLLVNLIFVSKHCKTDNHVKAVVCHEFLHVLLRHTERTTMMTAERHIALDSVINAIIHRQYGYDYSGMMADYYKNVKGIQKLLRPMNLEEQAWFDNHCYPKNQLPQWVMAWSGLYEGKLVADDIEGLAQKIKNEHSDYDQSNYKSGPFKLDKECHNSIDDLIGNHSEFGLPLPDDLADILNQILKEMNGNGIWRSPKQRGVGANPYEALFNAQYDPMTKWQQKTLTVLRQHLIPDRQSKSVRMVSHEYRIPILSSKDRRAFLRSLWDSFLPEAVWDSQIPKREGSAHIYLDVSGSMGAEMPQIIALLGRLSKYIKRPFWAFSDVVAPAIIERGQLKTDTTGGTSIQCVLEHVAKTRPQAAIVVTDGYIEKIDKQLVAKISATKLHVLLTRDGSPVEIRRIGLPYTQLDKVPT